MDFHQWSAKDVARLLALLEAELGFYKQIAATLPIPLAILSKDRAVVWTNRAFRSRFTDLPAHDLLNRGFTEIPLRAWHDEDQIETLLVLDETSRPASRTGTFHRELPAILWQADAATLQFRSVEGAEEILGYPAEHWLDRPDFFEARIHPDDRAAVMALYRGALTAGGEVSAEYRAVSASGELIWCRETIRVSGSTTTGVITNITDRKQLERQLLSAGRFEALYGFAGRVAHELNNPLMIVTGYTEELMQALKPDHPLRTEAGEILGAARRIAGLASQLSEFARPQGKPAIPVNIGDTILNLRSKITAAAGPRVAVELTVSRAPLLAMADPGQLGDVLSAVIAGSRERTHITIEWDVETVAERLSPTALAAGKYACIIVRDDGRGLDPEQAAGVFDPVLSKTADPAAVQSGLALARAYSVVHEWGGDIAYTSGGSSGGPAAGKGSTFTIYLPYVHPEGASMPPAALLRTADREREGAERETILVVDDESGIRELIRKILRREGYRVLEAGNAEEAVAAARGQAVDLVITDIMLPGINGPELARRMQQAAPQLKALFISGYTGQAIIPPGAPFLAKPFTLAALLEKVRNTLNR